MLFQNRLLTRAAPIQSPSQRAPRKGVISATNAQHHAVDQNRLPTRAAPIQSPAQRAPRKGVVSATNAQHHAVEDLAGG